MAVEKIKIGSTLNGKLCQVEVGSHQRLLDMLRGDLCLTDIKEGCGIGGRDACTVILDGRAATSCLTLAPSVDGRNVVTIEGVGCGGKLDPVQEAVPEDHAFQCGFCTPGFVMSAKTLLDENPDITREETRHAISGNLCRCTGYKQLTDAICQVARESKRLHMEKL